MNEDDRSEMEEFVKSVIFGAVMPIGAALKQLEAQIKNTQKVVVTLGDKLGLNIKFT